MCLNLWMNLPTEYLFQEFFKMLLEYMQRRSQLADDEFETLMVEQNIESEMER